MLRTQDGSPDLPVVRSVSPTEVPSAQSLIAGLQAHIAQHTVPRFGELRAQLNAIQIKLPKERGSPNDHFVGLLEGAYRTVVQVTACQTVERKTLLDGLASLERVLCTSTSLFDSYNLYQPVPVASDVVVDSGDLKKLISSFQLNSATCFIDCAEEARSWAEMLGEHLQRAGIKVTLRSGQSTDLASSVRDIAQEIESATVVLMIGTLSYPRHCEAESVITNKLLDRLEGGVYRLLLQGDFGRSFDAASSTRQLPSNNCCNPGLYLTQLQQVLKVVSKQVLGAAPLLPQGVEATNLRSGLIADLREAYAQKNCFRRFMGEKVKLESAYVVPDITGSLQAQERVWIVGEPGAGKSTLCHYIAYLYGTSQEHQLGEWAENCSGIIWIPLKELLLYDKNDISLAQLVADLWFDGEIVSGLEQWLQSPNLIYLLDSEEESYHLLPEKSARGRLLKQLLKKPRSIITSRTDERCPEATMKVELSLLDNTAVEVFAERYFTDVGTPEQAPPFLESIPHAMRELMQVPLTLELLCYRWSKSGHHSTAPIHLYQGILADLCRLKAEKLGEDLSSWTDEEVETEFPALPYLFEIAFQAKRQGKEGRIDPALYALILQQVERDQRQFISNQLFSDETFVHRVGRPAKLSSQSYRFHHAIFMDYCAARHLAPLLVDNGGDIESLIGNWATPENFSYWLQTVVLARALYLAIDLMRSPLQRAAASGNFEKMKRLLDDGALIHQTDEDGMTPLHLAAGAGHVEVAELLLDSGALIDPTTEDGATPLHKAAVGGHVEVAKLLLDREASIGQTIRSGETPLNVAVIVGQAEVAKALLDGGALVDQTKEDGKTLLHVAAGFGHVEVAQLLLDRGALVDQAMKNGRTSLHVAVLSGHVEIVQLLLDREASINQAEENGMTPLYMAATRGYVEIVQLLLERGALVDQAMKNGMTPLYVAATWGYVEIVRLLLERGASIDQAHEKGMTPLLMAVTVGHVEVVQLLLERGASTDQAEEKGITFIYMAVTMGHVEVAQLLLDAGVLVDQADNGGRTSLHEAANRGYAEMVQLLLRNGASVDAKAKDGATPLELARLSGHDEVRGLLTSSSRQ